MTLEEAITQAIDYEIRIRDLYSDAAKKVRDAAGRRFLEILRDDEQHHAAYLEKRLESLKASGVFNPGEPLPLLSFKKALADNLGKLGDILPREDLGDEKQILSSALQMEIETSAFYRKMVQDFGHEGQKMFVRFLEIEDAHIDAVQAELDHLSRTGYWFDFKEFDME